MISFIGAISDYIYIYDFDYHVLFKALVVVLDMKID